ncbi:MAG TPA: hypothetical protein DCY88_07105 [Cyanobacteria bacterium UBA11372]|nr:hypothetical protein [Cyanobacteria bacterium UBA11372]
MTISNDRLKSYEALITWIRRILSPLPDWVKRDIERYLNEIDSLILASRPPRFMIFGQRGAGKSSLINAIFGANVAEVGHVRSGTAKSEWFEYERDSKVIEFLDTRGLLEPSKTLPEKTILDAVRKNCPDVALFLCQAKLVNSGIDQVLDPVEKILREIKNIHQRDLRLIGLVTQCDLLHPSYIHKLPTDHAGKNKNIEDAVFSLTRHISSREFLRNSFEEVVPVSALAEYQEDGTIEPDFRCNIDRLQELLVKHLPKEAKNEMLRLAKIKEYQKSVASTIVYNRCSFAGVLAAAPIPIPNGLIVSLMQMAMIGEIMYISGEDFSLENVGYFLTNIGFKGAFIGVGGELAGGIGDLSWDSMLGFFAEGIPDYLAGNLLPLLPGLGTIIAGWGAAKATETLGKAAIAHFIDKTPIEEVRQQFGFGLA